MFDSLMPTMAEAVQSDETKLKVTASTAAAQRSVVANTPVNGAAGTAVDDALVHAIDGGSSLTAGARYSVEVWPDVGAGGAVSDVIWGWLLNDGDATGPASQGDGLRIATGYPREIVPVTGKLRLTFLRDSNTAFPCRVYCNRIDA